MFTAIFLTMKLHGKLNHREILHIICGTICTAIIYYQPLKSLYRLFLQAVKNLRQ